MSFRTIGLLIAIIPLAACGSGPSRSVDSGARVIRGGATESIRLDPQASTRNFTLPVPVDDAWDALWAAYRSLERPVVVPFTVSPGAGSSS